jgi:hypothetical protein
MSVFKRIVISFIIFSPVIGVGTGRVIEREKLPIITDIGLIKEIPDKTSELPEELSIGITITNDAFYKLLHKSEILKGGTLKKGLNRLGINAENLFKESGTHVYILETKADQYGFKYEITIDIQLETAAEVSPAPSVPAVQSSSKPGSPDPKIATEPGERAAAIQYDLSMYVEGRFIARTRKEEFGSVFESSMKGIQKAIESEPGHPGDTVNPTALSIPILPLMKAILKKKRTSAHPQPRAIRMVFIQEDKGGASKEVNAVISLKSRVIENISQQ